MSQLGSIWTARVFIHVSARVSWSPSHRPCPSALIITSLSLPQRSNSTPGMASSFLLINKILPVLQTHFTSCFYNDIFHDGPVQVLSHSSNSPRHLSMLLTCPLIKTYEPHDLRAWFLSLAGIQTLQDRNHISIISDIIIPTHSEVLLSNEKAVVFGLLVWPAFSSTMMWRHGCLHLLA